ncbi:MAG TPA: S1C family serine protease [Stellaceae bacterium]|nr:S1C family serine protease [Stellaceae bacterium]HMD66006.1 S1C family serine protease [Stellaceae bacterium]
MSRTVDWEIPGEIQPKPGDFAFDLDRALSAVLGLRATIPEDAFTAGTLGTERAGSGVLIRRDGLVLTIGYLVTEAETIWLTSVEGGAVPGHLVAYDQESGFGLVQALGRLNAPPIDLGVGLRVGAGDRAVMAAEGGRRHAIAARVVARQEFAGYWEYVLDRAIFTAPAHPLWGGAGLIGADGRLIGIGSLHVQRANGRELRRDVNMVVPIDLLPPILDDMLTYGRPNRPPRPWLGLYAQEVEDAVVVAGLAERGPAGKAGLRPGDRILAVREDPVASLAGLWRKIWAGGPAGSEVVLRVGRDNETLTVRVLSVDRTQFWKAPKLH